MPTRQTGTRVQTPPRRPLKIYAFDPMLGRNVGNKIVLDVRNEPLAPGPYGQRIQVMDYDGAAGVYYEPVDLNAPEVLVQSGLEPSEADPRFHQQMVYAVASKVLENFEVALGRRLTFRQNKPLKIYPHAFIGANAFYDPKLVALLFGYFKADQMDPGANLPGQTIFTCLSHDIIAHETTHALIDRLKRYFIEPSNSDVPAFHEGFADIVAIFQHFSFSGILRDKIQQTRANLREPSPLISLAEQFGYATGKGQALRNAIANPNPSDYQTMFEPHERGSILVAAIFDAFFQTYQLRIRDLVKLATDGSGLLPQGDLDPNLVNLIANEAAKAAQSILTMCIRAIDYLPPVDITFGDYLRALITADYELSPSDQFGQRAAIIEAFRIRGIYPDSVSSLAEESLLWGSTDDYESLPEFFPVEQLGDLLRREAAEWSRSPATMQFEHVQSETCEESANSTWLGTSYDDPFVDLDHNVVQALAEYALKNRKALGLHPSHDLKVSVTGFHPVFRVAPTGDMLVELVAQFTQSEREINANDERELGGLPMRGGTTVIASASGKIKYVISKPLLSPNLTPEQWERAEQRKLRQIRYVQEVDVRNPLTPYCDVTSEQYRTRMKNGLSFAGIHRGLQK